jgi:hypothetical protein
VLEFPGGLDAKCIIEKDLLNTNHIFGELIYKVVSVGGLGANDPKYELMFRHFCDVLMHPRGNTAVDKRIASFQYQTDSHSKLLIPV